MEIVKRLEGSESEEYDVNFEEEKFEEETLEEEKKEKKKKSIVPLFISLVLISIVGYFGFKSFNSQSATNINELNISSSTITKEKPQKVSEPVVKKSKATKEKVAVYTEELAQSIKPVVVQKTPTPKPKPTPKIETQKIIVAKDVPNNKITIYTEELAKAIEPKKITPKKPVVKKPVVKKTVAKKPVIKKHKPKKVVIKKKRKAKKTKLKQRIITVKKGDTLALMAQKYYGNPMEFKRIVRANRKLKSHKTNLKLGEKIIVPYLPKNKRRRFVIVKKGYSLAYISKKFYGTTKKVQQIVNANRNIKNKKSTLKIGQKVYVPR